MKPYRAIPIGKKEFVYGWYQRTDPSTPDKVKHYIIDCCGVTGTALALAHTISDFPGYHEVIPETVGQQLSFDAQNGDKIYEGDIAEHSCGTLYIIEQTKVGWNPFDEHCVKPHRIMRIIGTIHTTPELMEGK